MIEGQLMREDVSCRNILLYASYVTKKLGQRYFLETFKGVIKNSEFITLDNESGKIEPLDLEYLVNCKNWISNDANILILKNISSLGINMHNLGFYVASNLPFSQMFGILDKEKAFEKLNEVSRILNTSESIEITNLTKNSATINVKYERTDLEKTKEMCEFNRGFYAGLLNPLGNLRIEETKCVHNKDDYCSFDATWKERTLIQNVLKGVQELFYCVLTPYIKKDNEDRKKRSKVLVEEVIEEIGREEESCRALKGRNFQLLTTKSKLEETLTELKGTQQDMIESASLAAVGQWLSEIVHDSRNVNSAISGTTTQILITLRKETYTKESIEKRCNLILDAVISEQDMFEDLLRYVKGEPVSIEKREVDLGEYVTNLCYDAKCIVGEEVTIKTDIGYTGQIYIDKRKMTTRVVNNLLKNAAEAMKKKGEITIKTSKNDNYTEIWISDNGPGIPDEVRPRLFRKFSTYGKEKGTGLGLSIAKRFVEEHGGKLDVESYTEATIREGYLFDKKPGTTFKILIPNKEA